MSDFLALFFSIAGCLVSACGLVVVFLSERYPKGKIALAIVLAILLALSGTALFTSSLHSQQIDRLQMKITAALSSDMLTLDDLYLKVFPPRPHELVREALYDAIEEGMIGWRAVTFQSNGKRHSTKVFYVR